MSRRCYSKFHTFICKLVSGTQPKANITAEAKDILNSLIYDLCDRYAQHAARLCKHGGKITLDSNAIETLTKIWLGEDSEPLLESAHTAWENYSQCERKGVTKYVKAGLQLPPTRIKNIIGEQLLKGQKIGETCYIFLTAIIEYVIKSLVVCAIDLGAEESKVTVNGRLLYNAINSSEMRLWRPLFPNTFIAGFGVVGDQMLMDTQFGLLSVYDSDTDTETSSDNDSESVTNSRSI